MQEKQRKTKVWAYMEELLAEDGEGSCWSRGMLGRWIRSRGWDIEGCQPIEILICNEMGLLLLVI